VFGDEADINSAHPQALSWDVIADRLGMQYSAGNEAEIRAAAMKDNAVEVGR
jgi:hypothetical protein